MLAERLHTSEARAKAVKEELDTEDKKLQAKRDQCSSLAEQLDQLQVRAMVFHWLVSS